MSSNDKLAHAGIAYILQDNSVFPDMTVEENLMLGGYTLPMATAKRSHRASFCQVCSFGKAPASKSRRPYPAASGDFWKYRGRWLAAHRCCWWMNRPSVWSLATLTWFLKYWPIYARAKAKPLSWWNKRQKRIGPLPTSAMC